MQISPARHAAFEILRRVEAEGAYSSVLLATHRDLSIKDRALCHELVLGVLRRRLWLDRALEHFASRRFEKLDLPVALALRLGLYQLRFLARIPSSAAVNESVNLVRLARVKSAASFVNAVLRRATREPDYDPTAGLTDQLEKVAVETSHPPWLIARWCSQFGEAEAAALARTNNQPAPLAFRFTARAARERQTPEQMIDVLRAAGADVIPSEIAPGAWRYGGRRDTQQETEAQAGSNDPEPQLDSGSLLRKLSDDGLIYFQDEGSQLVAHLIGLRDGERVLDVCAAPGSKSTLLAALAPEALVVSGDLYEHRVRTMNELAARQGAANIQTLVNDAARHLPFPNGAFDRVLVDAPCSGTGTLRHNPEIRWRLEPPDINLLAARQRLILHHAAATVAPRGLLVYSTCSLETDENEAVVRAFLNSQPQFSGTPLDVSPGLLTVNGEVRTWPQYHDTDGFFVAALRRES